MTKLTQEGYISKCISFHGDRYDYSKVVYTGAHNKITIICKTHGEFSAPASAHMRGKAGCNSCIKLAAAMHRAETYQIKLRARHGDRITVSTDEYLRSYYGQDRKDPVKAFCKLHGVFEAVKEILPNKGDCPECRLDKTYSEFVDKCKEIHKGRYTYSRSDYISSRDYMDIYCTGCDLKFPQRPAAHAQGQNCPHCKEGNFGAQLTEEALTLKLSKVIGTNHDYSKVVVKPTTEGQVVRCKVHGDFSTTPAQPTDCRKCTRLSKDNLEIEKIKAYCISHSPETEITYSNLVYADSKSCITLTCSKHGDWVTSPNKLMKPDRTMCCPSCIKEVSTAGRWHPKVVKRDPAKYKNIKQDLYLLSASVGDEEIIKVGVTRNKSSRFSQIRSESGQDWQEVTSTVGYNMYSSVMAESFLKKKLKDFKYSSPVWFGGHTELFKVDKETKDWLISFIGTLDYIGACKE